MAFDNIQDAITDKIRRDSQDVSEWYDDPNTSSLARFGYDIANQVGQAGYNALFDSLPILKRTGLGEGVTYEKIDLNEDAEKALAKQVVKFAIQSAKYIDTLPSVSPDVKKAAKTLSKGIANYLVDNDEEIAKIIPIVNKLDKDIIVSVLRLPKLPKVLAKKLAMQLFTRGGKIVANKVASTKANPKAGKKQGGSPKFIAKRGGNSLDWYTHYRGLAKAGAGLQFQMPNGTTLGHRMQFSYKGPNGNWSTIDNASVSDVASLRVHLTLGSVDQMAYLNRLYAAIRRTNSGAINYTTLDLHKYLLNYRGVALMYAVGKRAYGTLMSVDRYNVNKPQILLAAQGLDYDTFADNAANLRYKLNQIAHKLAIFTPYNFDVFKRTEWLFSNIYKTSNGYKDQCIVMCPDYAQEYWNYSTNAMGSFISAAPSNANQTGLTYANYIAQLELVVNNLSAATNNINAIIAGDMLKTYGVGQIRTIGDIPENYSVVPVYNEEVLDQISNASLIPTQSNLSLTATIAVNSNGTGLTETINYTPYGDVQLSQSDWNIYLNCDKNNIDDAYILGMSRFTAAFDTANSAITSFGTEVITTFGWWFWSDTIASSKYNLLHSEFAAAISSDLSSPGAIMGLSRFICAAKAYDYLPKFKIYTKTFNVGNNGSIVISGQLDSNGRVQGDWTAEMNLTPWVYDWANWAPVTETELQAIHNAAVQSLYYIPMEVKPNNNLVAIS